VTIGTRAYAGLELDNLLEAMTPGIWLPPPEYDIAPENGQSKGALLQETDGYLFFPSDPSELLGPYAICPMSPLWVIGHGFGKGAIRRYLSSYFRRVLSASYS
jgi:hypothetical protein